MPIDQEEDARKANELIQKAYDNLQEAWDRLTAIEDYRQSARVGAAMIVLGMLTEIEE